jgi:hypothetical protein
MKTYRASNTVMDSAGSSISSFAVPATEPNPADARTARNSVQFASAVPSTFNRENCPHTVYQCVVVEGLYQKLYCPRP